MYKIILLSLFALVILLLEIIFIDRKTRETNTRTPDSRHFKALGTGSLVDNNTGLTWQLCTLGKKIRSGRCEGKAQVLSWKEARSSCRELVADGHSDWRLPTRAEFGGILNCNPEDLSTCNLQERFSQEARARCRRGVSGKKTFWAQTGTPDCVGPGGKRTACSWAAGISRTECGYYHGALGKRTVKERFLVRCVR